MEEQNEGGMEKGPNVFQRLLCVLDVCGLRCSIQTRNLKDHPKETTQAPSVECFKTSIDWKKIKFAVIVLLNIVGILCGVAILIALGLLKFNETPSRVHGCKYRSLNGRYPDEKCWHDLLDSPVSIQWSTADYIFMSSGILVLFFSIVSLTVVWVKKRDYPIFIGLLIICTIIHGAGLGIMQNRDMYDSDIIAEKEQNRLINNLRHSVSKINNNDFSSYGAKDTWETIQENCNCCGIFSYEDWTTIPKSCYKSQESPMCFGRESYYRYNNYDYGRRADRDRRVVNATDAKGREGCLKFFVKSVARNIVHMKRDYFIAFVLFLVCIGSLIVLRGAMLLPCFCIKKKKSFDTEPLLESSDVEILKP